MPDHAIIPRPKPAAATEVEGLVTAAQAGDRDAFGELYRLFYDPVMRAILGQVDHDHDLAEDLTQQAFLDAWVCIGRTQFRSRNVRAWFVTIGCNRARKHWERCRPTDRVSYEYDIEALSRMAAGPVDDAATDAETRRAIVRRHIAECSEGQRRCLQLRFFEGLSQSETAAEMGRDRTTVRDLQAFAFRSLKRRLASELYGTA